MRLKRAAEPSATAGAPDETPAHRAPDGTPVRASSRPRDAAPEPSADTSAASNASASAGPSVDASPAKKATSARPRSSGKTPEKKSATKKLGTQAAGESSVPPAPVKKRGTPSARESSVPPESAKKRASAAAPKRTRSSGPPKPRKSVTPAEATLTEHESAPAVSSASLDSSAPAVRSSRPLPAGHFDEPAPESLPRRESNVPGGIMPYHPSAPCASCARGVDPLRAACVSMTERSVHFFCSRDCLERFLRAEDEHRQRLTTHARRVVTTDKPRPLLSTPVRSATLEPVARRVAPTKASTPLWPLLGAALCAIAMYLPVPGAQQAGAFALLGVSIVFASRTPRTRSEGGVLTWLSGPVAVGLFGLSAWLGPGGFVSGRGALLAGALGVALAWLREHSIERASAAQHARSTELSARLSRRVQVSLAPRAASDTALIARSETGPRTVERAVEGVREGDEVWCEAGSVIPVDGVVTEGAAEVLPYPRARTPIERAQGNAVLAGALVVSGSLRVTAQRVGDQRALFEVLHDSAQPGDDAVGALAIAARARGLRGALWAVAALLLVALVAPHAAAAKLAGAAAALLALPALALSRGVRNVLRAAVQGAAARGVRFRDATTIERAGRTDTAVLRVEGVVVPRVYTLVQVVSLSEGYDATALLALALAAGSANEESQGSTAAREVRTHAIARAVREHAEQLGVEPAVLKRITLARGLGVSALTDGQGPLVFGSRQALLSAGVSVAAADREAQRAESSGQRVVFLALGGRVRGLLVFAQGVRGEARLAVQTLFDLGLEVELVSGDHRATVESIARTLDITQLKAELSAEQRAAEVRRLCDGEAHVVALGQAPADEAMLTAAGLSLCLDAAAQPHRHEPGQAVSYDITTATCDLRDAVVALVLARQARRALRRVLVAAALGATAGVLGAAGVAPPLLVVLLAAGVDLVCLGSAPGFGGRRWGAAARRAEGAA